MDAMKEALIPIINALIVKKDIIQIKRLQKKLKMTVVFVTHDFQEAMLFSDYLYVMDRGTIVEQGAPKDVLNSDNEFVKDLYRASVINTEREKYGD